MNENYDVAVISDGRRLIWLPESYRQSPDFLAEAADWVMIMPIQSPRGGIIFVAKVISKVVAYDL